MSPPLSTQKGFFFWKALVDKINSRRLKINKKKKLKLNEKNSVEKKFKKNLENFHFFASCLLRRRMDKQFFYYIDKEQDCKVKIHKFLLSLNYRIFHIQICCCSFADCCITENQVDLKQFFHSLSER